MFEFTLKVGSETVVKCSHPSRRDLALEAAQAVAANLPSDEVGQIADTSVCDPENSTSKGE